MTTPTSNPVPSQAPQDMLFNVETLDALINGSALTVAKRLGGTAMSWAGVVDGLSAEAAITATGVNRAAAAVSAEDAAAAIPLAEAAAMPALAAGRIKGTIAEGMTAYTSTTLPDSLFWVTPNTTDSLTALTAYRRTGAGSSDYVLVTAINSYDDYLRLKSRTGGVTVQYTAPNAYDDPGFAKLMASANNALDPDGLFTSSGTPVTALVTLSDGRPAMSLTSSSGSGQGARAWRVPIALLGVAAGGVVTALFTIMNRVGGSNANNRVLLQQFTSAGAEITGVRQTYTVPAAPLTDGAHALSATVDATCAFVGLSFGAANSAHSYNILEIMLAAGAVSDYRASARTYINTLAAAAAAASAITTEKSWLERPNLIGAGAFDFSALPYSGSPTGDISTGTFLGEKCWVLTATGSGNKSVILGPYPASSFDSVISAGLRILDVSGPNTGGSAIVYLQQFDADGAEITGVRQSLTATNSAAVSVETPVAFANIAKDSAMSSVRLLIQLNAGGTSRTLAFRDPVISRDTVATWRPPSPAASSSTETASDDPVSVIGLPDSTPGRTVPGFTCTGLDRITAGTYKGCWVIGDDGRMGEGLNSNTDFAPALHILDRSCSRIYATIAGGYTGASLQGVAYDSLYATPSAWAACSDDGTIRHYTLPSLGPSSAVVAGAEVTGDRITMSALGISSFAPNALAFDATRGTGRGALWVGDKAGTTAYCIDCDPSAATHILATITLANNPDQFQKIGGKLYYQYGANGQRANIRTYDLTAGTEAAKWGPLTDAIAPEGFYYDSVTKLLNMVVDGGYHNSVAGPRLNAMYQYKVSAP